MVTKAFSYRSELQTTHLAHKCLSTCTSNILHYPRCYLPQAMHPTTNKMLYYNLPEACYIFPSSRTTSRTHLQLYLQHKPNQTWVGCLIMGLRLRRAFRVLTIRPVDGLFNTGSVRRMSVTWDVGKSDVIRWRSGWAV